jgi:hypothetical protein
MNTSFYMDINIFLFCQTPCEDVESIRDSDHHFPSRPSKVKILLANEKLKVNPPGGDKNHG